MDSKGAETPGNILGIFINEANGSITEEIYPLASGHEPRDTVLGISVKEERVDSIAEEICPSASGSGEIISSCRSVKIEPELDITVDPRGQEPSNNALGISVKEENEDSITGEVGPSASGFPVGETLKPNKCKKCGIRFTRRSDLVKAHPHYAAKVAKATAGLPLTSELALSRTMSAEEDLLFASAAFIIIENYEKIRKRRKRRFWVHPSLQSRAQNGTSDLIKDLLLDDLDELNLEYRSGCGFKKFFRMKSSDFEILLNKIAHIIKKEDTPFRRSIPPEERLAVTLRFLATGDSYHSLSHTFKISKQIISNIIPIVCDAIVSVLQDYIKMPQNEAEWNVIAKEFNDKWNFPNCVGAFDGKHIILQSPINCGTEYFNYKGFFSIVLFTVIDANYNFIYTNVGCQGRISDESVFSQTTFKECLKNITMHLPPPGALTGKSNTTPFVFVADDAFPMSKNIMKPFPGAQIKGSKQRVFNFRLSRARRVSENAFGIISSAYRILRRPMLLQPERAKNVLLAVLHLHNYLRKSNSKSIYNPPGSFDSECSTSGEISPGVWRQSPSNQALVNIPRTSIRSTDEAQAVRNEFAEFFTSPAGTVPFQHDK